MRSTKSASLLNNNLTLHIIMGLVYTKKNDETNKDDRTVKPEDFARRMMSMKQIRNEENKKELPKTEIQK